MAFKKGVSGNPAGRKKENAEVTALAQQEAPEAFKRIVALSKGCGDIKVELAANQAIVDRACGKAPQAVQLTGTVEVVTQVIINRKLEA